MPAEERGELRATWLAGGVTAAILFIVVAFYIGRGCEQAPQPVDDLGIDAGPGEAAILADLDAALRHAEVELARIEREHAADIAAFEAGQEAKYEEIRSHGPEVVAAWFTDFNRRLRDAGLPR
jgi:hypothetical protein